jgi:hypothetical protein
MMWTLETFMTTFPKFIVNQTLHSAVIDCRITDVNNRTSCAGRIKRVDEKGVTLAYYHDYTFMRWSEIKHIEIG